MRGRGGAALAVCLLALIPAPGAAEPEALPTIVVMAGPVEVPANAWIWAVAASLAAVPAALAAAIVMRRRRRG